MSAFVSPTTPKRVNFAKKTFFFFIPSSLHPCWISRIHLMSNYVGFVYGCNQRQQAEKDLFREKGG